MSLAVRATGNLLRAVGRQLWGFAPNLMPEIAARLGPVGAIKWFATNMPRYERMLKDFGPLSGHLLCMEASLSLGCPYCIYGHARAFELHYFKIHQKLFPIDEHQWLALRELEDEPRWKRTAEVLTESGLAAELPRLRRLWALKFEGAKPETKEDEQLMLVIGMFEVLNFCALDSTIPVDEAHDPIQKDEATKAAYARARLAQAAKV